MKIRDAFDAKSVALYTNEVASNKIPYLGAGLFPSKKKMGLDLKWIKTSKGLPVSLTPTTFDSKSTIRSREGFSIDKTEMAFFRESMLVTEHDEQEIMRAEDTTDPYAVQIIANIFNDTATLVEGADVVPERMRMQLLAPTDGNPKILISANETTYSYNYDPDNTYKTNNFVKLLGTSMWYDTKNSDPLEDLRDAQDSVEDRTGNRPVIALMSKKTMGYIVKNEKIRSAVLAQNITANVFMTEQRVKDLIANELGLAIVVYNKKYKNESGSTVSFYPDDMVTLLPDGALGSTWYGTTPEERTLMGSGEADVAIVNTGVAIAVKTTEDPVNTKTTVSEIVLPSYERMDDTYALKVYTDYARTFTGVVAAGAVAGAKITLTPSTPAGTGTAYYYKITDDAAPLFGAVLDNSWTAYTSANDISVTVGKTVVICEANSTSLSVEAASSFYIDAVTA